MSEVDECETHPDTAGVPLLTRFSANLLSLAKFVSVIISDAHKQGLRVPDPKLVRVLCYAIKLDGDKRLMTNFIQQSSSIWNRILDKDERVLVKHGDLIFRGLPTGHLNYLGILEQAKVTEDEDFLTEDERDSIWEHLRSFVLMAREYEAHQR